MAGLTVYHTVHLDFQKAFDKVQHETHGQNEDSRRYRRYFRVGSELAMGYD